MLSKEIHYKHENDKSKINGWTKIYHVMVNIRKQMTFIMIKGWHVWNI